MAKTVIFVQGGNLEREATFPWLFFHLHPGKEPTPESVDLAFFDYPAGKLKTWKNLLLKRGKAPAQAPDSETELTPKVKIRLESGLTDDNGPDRASVLALYDWIKRQPKGSIRSLQIFAHAYIFGPVLWNSYEYDVVGSPMNALSDWARDPNDTDFRIRDFVGANPLAGTEGKKFADAFASDALIKIWGCNYVGLLRRTLLKCVGAPSGSGGDRERKEALLHYLSWLKESFPMKMAVHLNLAVWASPLGYGTAPWSKVMTDRKRDPPCSAKEPRQRCMSVKYRGIFPPDLTKDRWWRVSWLFRNRDKGVEFYRDVLKAQIDATDYVEYKKSWFDAAERIAHAAVQPEAVESPMGLQRRISNQVEQLKIA